MKVTTKAARHGNPFYAVAAIACFTYAALVLVLLHLLRPDYTPASHMISDYAVGAYGWVMTTWFAGVSMGCLILVLGLNASGLTSWLARTGFFLLGVAAIGLLVSAAFPTDLEEAATTQTGNIHTISFLVNVLSILVATTLLSISFGGHREWRSYRSIALGLSALIIIAFVLQFLSLHRGAPYGLANRLFVTTLFAWLFATSFRLRALLGASRAEAR